MEYTINIKRFVEYALDQKKSLKFKVEYDFPPTLYKSRDEKLKKEFQLELKSTKLVGYVNRLIHSKTYLNSSGRKVIYKFIKSNNIIDHSMRKKVS